MTLPWVGVLVLLGHEALQACWCPPFTARAQALRTVLAEGELAVQQPSEGTFAGFPSNGHV